MSLLLSNKLLRLLLTITDLDGRRLPFRVQQQRDGGGRR
jgi:hypothetical protein